MVTNYLKPLEEERVYHLYNQGNNHEKIFINDENKRYFKEKFEYYMCPFVTIICMCLMDNHFHYLIRIKTWEEMKESIGQFRGLAKFITRMGLMQNRTIASMVVSEMLRRFFMAYAKAFNNMYNRSGSLFRKNFRRKEITSMQYLRNIILYIHSNPSKHGYRQDFRDYPWSTYNEWFEQNAVREEFGFDIYTIFGEKNNYIMLHILKKDSYDENQIE